MPGYWNAHSDFDWYEATGMPIERLDPGAPTAERRRHGVIVGGLAAASDTELARAGAVVRRAVPPIDRYRAQRLLTHRQCDAADRLRLDYEIGVVGARGGEPLLDRVDGQAPGNGGIERRLDALKQWRLAGARLGRLQAIVVPVVVGEAGGGEVTAAAVARNSGRSVKAVMALLGHGLDVLADFYGLAE